MSVDDTWTLRQVLAWTTAHFQKHGIDAPRLTAELLLAHGLGRTRVAVYTDGDVPLTAEERARLRGLIQRRVQGEPTAYLTGVREFYTRPFRVDARVLIPRPETECLVDAALERMPRGEALQVVDVCTGSGCIALTVAAERPAAAVAAVDIDAGALQVAQANAVGLGLETRVTFFEGALLGPLREAPPADLVLSNPPYLDARELASLQAEVAREPRLALDGGPDGLDVYRALIPQAWAHLKPGGWVVLELGDRQADAVSGQLQAAGFQELKIINDYNGIRRIVAAQKGT